MKLEIDLMNADEVAAGLVLLGKIGEAQAETKAAIRTIPPGVVVPRHTAEFVQRTQVEEGEEFYTPPVNNEHVAKGCEQFPDAAQVFGGTPVSIPLPPTTVLPVVPVPSVPNPPIPGPVTSVELDAKGLPWDSRIHSSSKNKVANGCWKVARGKAPEYVAQVEAELKGGMPVTVPLPLAPTVTVTAGSTPIPTSAPASVVIPPPPTGVAPDPTTFETLMTRISPQISAGVLPPLAVMEACKTNGLQSVVGLQTSPQLVPLVWATLKAQYPALS